MTTQILVVEDEPVIALDIRQRLAQLGYSVTAIADCTETAMQALTQTLPDLVLMDIHLRGTNGIETAAQIREKYNLPIIFLTAHADQDTIKKAKAIHPFGYIVKPFETHDLSTSIEIALSRFQAEHAIQIALEQERELNQLKSQFVAIVSHEFRNPLSSILFSLDLLEAHGEQLTHDKRQIYFQRARTCVNRMNELLEEVLVLGEAESGKLECHPTPLPLLQFCTELVEELQSTIGYKHRINLAVEGQMNVHQTYSLDQKLLQHILSNLISNAIKYSPENSNITLTLRDEPKAMSFCIHDEGIGISPEDQVKLFTCFYRGTNVGTIPGTGLGLAIVKQCVESHDGCITVNSAVGKGTTFTVTLPAL